MPTKKPNSKKRKAALTVQFPDEIGDTIRDFCEERDMIPAHLARTALRFFMPRLLSGEASIVNGEIQMTKK